MSRIFEYSFGNLSLNNRNYLTIIGISIIIFCIFPWIGLLLAISLTFISNNKQSVPLCFILMWLYIILIQSQRQLIPIIDDDSDWGNYNKFYLQCKNYQFIFTPDGSKDIFFTLWNVVFYNLIGDKFIVFADSTVDITILLYALGAYRIWKYTAQDARYGLCALCMVFFLVEIQLISNNLLRQQFATAIMFYGIILKQTKGRWYWTIFLMCALLTHSMTVFLIPLYLISLSKRFPIKYIERAFLIIFSLLFVFSLIRSSLFSSSIYILNRIGTADMYFSTDVIDVSVVYVFSLLVIFIYIKHYFFDKKINKSIWIGSNIVMYVTLVCLITANMPLIVTRIYITRLGLLSLFIPYFFVKKSMIATLYHGFIIIFFITRFMFFTHNAYIDISKFALLPIFTLL